MLRHFLDQRCRVTRAFDDADQVSSLACDILGPVLQHHLKHSIPWFLTCIGACKEAQVAGHVISYQSWHYDEKLALTARKSARCQPRISDCLRPPTGRGPSNPART